MLIMKNVILALRSIEAKNRYFCQLSTLEECLFAILHNQYTGDHAWLGLTLGLLSRKTYNARHG